MIVTLNFIYQRGYNRAFVSEHEQLSPYEYALGKKRLEINKKNQAFDADIRELRSLNISRDYSSCYR